MDNRILFGIVIDRVGHVVLQMCEEVAEQCCGEM